MKDKYRIPLFITLVLVSVAIFVVNRNEIVDKREADKIAQWEAQEQKQYNEAVGCHEFYDIPKNRLVIDSSMLGNFYRFVTPVASNGTIWNNYHSDSTLVSTWEYSEADTVYVRYYSTTNWKPINTHE